MKAFTDRSPARIGLGVLGAMVVAIAFVFLFNQSIFHPTFSVTALFPENAGLAVGDQVLVAGVKVGTVGAITQTGNRVRVQLELYDGTQLPEDSSAAITVQTLLGLVGVDLSAGTQWSHLLSDGSVISRTSIPVEYYQLQNAAGQDLVQTDTGALNQLIRSLADITEGKQQQVQQIIGGLAQFTQTVNDNSAQLASLIDAATTLSGAFAGRQQQLVSTLGNLDTVVSGLAANSTAVGNLIDGIDQAAAQTAQLVGGNRPQLDSLLTHLHSVLQVVNSHQLDVAQGVAYLEKAVQGFASIGYSGPGARPNPSWSSIYVNLSGTFGIYGFIGPCGTVDEALDQAIGPDPRACSQRTGPLPAFRSTPLPGDTQTNSRPPDGGGTAGGQTGAPGRPMSSTSTDPPAAPSALPGIFSTMLGGSR